MQKVVLSEISLIHGEVKTPEGFEIDLKTTKTELVKIKKTILITIIMLIFHYRYNG